MERIDICFCLVAVSTCNLILAQVNFRNEMTCLSDDGCWTLHLSSLNLKIIQKCLSAPQILNCSFRITHSLSDTWINILSITELNFLVLLNLANKHPKRYIKYIKMIISFCNKTLFTKIRSMVYKPLCVNFVTEKKIAPYVHPPPILPYYTKSSHYCLQMC